MDNNIEDINNRLKELEAVLKKKSKVKSIKTITISASTHSDIKKYCAKNGIKIGEWVEEILIKEIKSKSK